MKENYFRSCVGGLIFREQDKKIMVFERASLPGVWQLPQGGVDDGESLEQAVIREIYEETGLVSADLCLWGQHPLWLGYEIPDNISFYCRGQVQKWFIFSLIAQETSVNLSVMSPKAEFKDWKWMTGSELKAITESFKAPVIHALVDWFEGSFKG